jgi:hypothetical protein
VTASDYVPALLERAAARAAADGLPKIASQSISMPPAVQNPLTPAMIGL